MNVVTRGFSGRLRWDDRLPPGQYLAHDFPVLSAGATPLVPTDMWTFTVTTELGVTHRWTWADLMRLHAEDVTRTSTV
jgi:hypothetical protein